MKILIALLLLLPISVLACGDHEKPALVIEKDFVEEPNDQCGYYFVVVPTMFNNSTIRSIIVRYGQTLGFNLAVHAHDKEDFSMAALCASRAWLEDANLRITYTKLPASDGSISLCLDQYEYDDLSQLIEE